MFKINEINQEIINEIDCLDGFGVVHKTAGSIVQYRTNQWFAVDHAMAYDITPYKFTDDDGTHIFTPVVVGGSTFHSCPDEGRSGMLTIWEYKNFRNRPDGCRLIWSSRRWVYTAEIEKT